MPPSHLKDKPDGGTRRGAEGTIRGGPSAGQGFQAYRRTAAGVCLVGTHTFALPGLVDRKQEADVDFRITVFTGAGHAFFNDGNPVVYREEAAAAA